jgi:hypothetical protein
MLTPVLAQAFRPEPDFYVGWLTLALINAGIAQSKNRSGLLWWLLSLLLGPIATFILVTFCDRLPAATK